MTQPGRAAIEIVGDVSNLGAQLQRDTQRAVDHIDLNTDTISEQLAEGFEEGVEQGIEALGDLEQAAEDAFSEIGTAATQAASTTADSFDKAGESVGKVFGDVSRTAKKELVEVGDAIDGVKDAFVETERKGRPLSKLFTTIGNGLASVSTSLVEMGASLPTPAGLLTFLAGLVAVVALTGPLLALGGALADLAGLVTVLPAAIGVLAVSLAAITIAFQGFGDAIGAVIEGDADKIAEALKKLAPAARSVVIEFQKLLPQFRDLGDAVQQSFFAPLVGNLTILAKATLPTLKSGLADVAEAIGRAGSNFAEFLSEREQVETLSALLATTSRVIDSVAVGADDLGRALFKAMGAALPQIERLADALGEGLTKFAAFISKSVEDGSFQEFFEDAVATLGKLVDLGGALGELLGALFGETDDEGRDFLTTLTDLVQRMTEFFKSAEGKDAINDLVEQIQAVAVVVGYLVNAFLFVIEVLGTLDDAVNATIGFFISAGTAIGDFWDGLVTTVEDAAATVLDFLGQTAEDIVTFFKELPGKIGDFITTAFDFVVEKIKALPGSIVAAFDLILDQVITSIGLAVAAVILVFTELPGQIMGALEFLKNLIVDAFIFARDKVVEITVAIVEYVQGLPEKIGELFTLVKDGIVSALTTALEFLASVPGRIAGFFQSAKDQASNKIGEFVALVKGLPGRIVDAIGDLGQLLYAAGQKVINGLINGLKSRVGQLRETISSAVQEIRDHLPFSPAKTGPLSGGGSPQIAGATIAEMIAAGIDSQLATIAAAAARAAGSAVLPNLGISPFGDAAGTPLVGPTTGTNPSPLAPVQTTTEPQQVFIVQIGNEQVDAHIERIVEERVSVEVRRIMNGVRG